MSEPQVTPKLGLARARAAGLGFGCLWASGRRRVEAAR